MRILTNFAAICLAACSTLAVADTGTGTTKPADNPEKPKKICRSVVVTGSIMPSRVCLTKQEWAEVNGGRINETDRRKDAARMPSGRDSLGL